MSGKLFSGSSKPEKASLVFYFGSNLDFLLWSSTLIKLNNNVHKTKKAKYLLLLIFFFFFVFCYLCRQSSLISSNLTLVTQMFSEHATLQEEFVTETLSRVIYLSFIIVAVVVYRKIC